MNSSPLGPRVAVALIFILLTVGVVYAVRERRARVPNPPQEVAVTTIVTRRATTTIVNKVEDEGVKEEATTTR